MRKKAASLKIVSNAGKRPIRPEPQPTGAPVRPDFRDPEAIAFWDGVVPQLEELGLATAVDTANLTAMCEWWAEYRQAVGSDVDLYKRAITMAVCWKQFAEIAKRFGLSPQDRIGLPAPEKQEINPIEAIARRGRA